MAKKQIAAEVARMQKVIEKSLLGKLPQLNGSATVYLPLVYFKRLSDLEFIVLWEIKNMRIEVAPKTGDYIEKRRRMLGLHREFGSEVLSKDEFRAQFAAARKKFT